MRMPLVLSPAEADRLRLLTREGVHFMRVYCHRGMLRKAPENTLAAYQCAIDHGFDIETVDRRE